MTAIEEFSHRLDPEMCVVTAAAGGERDGCLVGFAAQCSIRPVRFTVWLSKANRTFRVAEHADRLAVHLLTREQHALAALFGGRTGDDGVDKFARVAWTERSGGALVLKDAPAWFVGRILRRTDAGDHVGFLLEPEEAGERKDLDGPLLRLSDALDIRPGHPAED
ncbi:flavin reductase family protein [Streptomyces sp. NPDC046831]|uniref:flavin reductase family protein n=1 Tax=Streptomyces sp. NPDC046831 TaxID=3154805 RepID=UPI0033F3046C